MQKFLEWRIMDPNWDLNYNYQILEEIISKTIPKVPGQPPNLTSPPLSVIDMILTVTTSKIWPLIGNSYRISSTRALPQVTKYILMMKEDCIIPKTLDQIKIVWKQSYLSATKWNEYQTQNSRWSPSGIVLYAITTQNIFYFETIVPHINLIT